LDSVFKFGLFALFPICLAACDPAFYVPNQLNMPLASEAKTIKASLYTGTGGVGAEASYTIDSHFVVMASGLSNNLSLLGRNQKFSYDIGGGMYLPVNNLVFVEGLAGLGYGRTDVDVIYNKSGDINDKQEDVMHGSYTRVFAQVDIVRNFELTNDIFGFGIRLSGLAPVGFSYRRFTIISSHASTTQPPPAPMIIEDSTLNHLSNALFIEPALSFNHQIGDHLIFHTSIGISYCLSGYNWNSQFNTVYWPVMATMGFTFMY